MDFGMHEAEDLDCAPGPLIFALPEGTLEFVTVGSGTEKPI